MLSNYGFTVGVWSEYFIKTQETAISQTGGRREEGDRCKQPWREREQSPDEASVYRNTLIYCQTRGGGGLGAVLRLLGQLRPSSLEETAVESSSIGPGLRHSHTPAL